MMTRISRTLLTLLALGTTRPAAAQVPRINTLYPIGGRSGSSVDVEVRGANLNDAETLMIRGNGVSGTVQPGGTKADETYKPLWQAKCGTCHELRSPANRSLTPYQWAATVERMVKVRQAPLSADEMSKVTQFLVGSARAGRVMARLEIAPNTLPGLYELRVGTRRGVSTASLFEVGDLPELVGANAPREEAQQVTLPCIANGCFLSNGEHHYFKFHAEKSRRYVFNMKAFRYNVTNQMYFNPDLRLTDSAGVELVENHGYFDLDPLIDWTCPADGDFCIEARDLLGHANPSSVYRLTMGQLPYDTVLYPPAARIGANALVAVCGKNIDGLKTDYTLPVPAEPGLFQAGGPFGPDGFYACSYPVVTDYAGGSQASTSLPAGFAGRVLNPGGAVVFRVRGAGAFEFEAFSSRLGSPISLQAALLNQAGSSLAATTGDGRMTASLEPGQTYSLKVTDASGIGGPDHVFFIEAHPARPGLECVARPDNVTVRPGLGTAVNVILTRREGVVGDVRVTAEGLPPGVTAEPVPIPPDRSETWLILRAAPGAGTCIQPFKIVAQAHGPAGDVRTLATPQELYRLNNEPRARDWGDCALAVRGQPDFTADIIDRAPIKVHPKNGVPVRVAVARKPGFKGAVTLFITGLPDGWTADPVNVPPGADRVEMTVRPNGGNTAPFLKRDPKLTPIRAFLEAQSDEFRFAFTTIEIAKPDRITDREEDR